MREYHPNTQKKTTKHLNFVIMNKLYRLLQYRRMSLNALTAKMYEINCSLKLDSKKSEGMAHSQIA